MSTADERRCIGCADTEENARLERCVVCGKWYCTDCSYRASGRRFCSQTCAREFYYGEFEDDDESPEPTAG